MIWNCSICICRLEGNKPCSCTPCGHIFHSDCLKVWVNNSQTCPECRRKVTQYSALKLYPFEKTLDASLDSSTLEYNLLAVKDEVKEKNEEINSLKAKIEKLSVYIAKAESEAETFRQQKMDMEIKLQIASLRLKNANDLEKRIHNLEVSLSDSTAELNFYRNIKTIVRGEQENVDHILNQYSSGTGQEDSIKQLAVYCSVLKRELNNSAASKNSLKDEATDLKNKNSALNQKYLKLKELNDALKQQVSQLEKENSNFSRKICSNCPSTSFATNNIQESQPETLKVFSDCNDSPITVNFTEKKKKIGVLVLEDDISSKQPSSSQPSNLFLRESKKNGIACRVNYGSCSGKTQDPKLLRRVKVSKTETLKKQSKSRK